MINNLLGFLAGISKQAANIVVESEDQFRIAFCKWVNSHFNSNWCRVLCYYYNATSGEVELSVYINNQEDMSVDELQDKIRLCVSTLWQEFLNALINVNELDLCAKCYWYLLKRDLDLDFEYSAGLYCRKVGNFSTVSLSL